MKKYVAVGCLGFACISANSAEQCVNLSGVYGAVTVTTSCTGQPSQVLNPSPLSINGRNSILLNDGGSNGPVACTFAFSKPLNTSSLRLYIDGQDNSPGITEERTAISINGSGYTVTSADLSGPLAGAFGPLPISAVAGVINGPQPSGLGSGTFAVTGSAPAALTSFTITYSGEFGTTFYSVCVDDADFVPVASGAVPIPTLSEWGLLLATAAMGLAAAWAMRRRGA